MSIASQEGWQGAGREPEPSPRVRLEAALLESDRAVPAVGASPDGAGCPTVLVVAAEADLRRYVRECLRERPALRLVEAATVPEALAIAARLPHAYLVVDEPERDLLDGLGSYRAVLLVDDAPREPDASVTNLRSLARPFSAKELVADVDWLVA